MKVVIPVAGVGSRLKPHTHTVPKPLMQVAGKPMLDYVIDEALKVRPSEIIFVVGYKKDAIIEHVSKQYPNIPVDFVEQTQRDGDGSAVRLALDGIDEDDDVVVFFGDTLIDFDLKSAIKKAKNKESLVFVMEVTHPEHYGVVETNETGEVISIEEKPQIPRSNMAVIGAYYFPSLHYVRDVLNNLYENEETMGGEYKLAQVLKYQINDKAVSIKASSVKKWFDCGRPEILLDSNTYFLQKHSTQTSVTKKGDSIIIPPCYIAKDAEISKSVIGPNVSIGSGSKIISSHLTNSIINEETQIFYMILEDSIIGKEVVAKSKATQLNIGEKSVFTLK